MAKEDCEGGVWRWIHGHPVFIKSKTPTLKEALQEKLEKKAKYINGVYSLDVRNQYEEKAHPGFGSVKCQSGVKFKSDDYSRDEVKEAHWLVDTFGGNVLILRENKDSKYYKYPTGSTMPDLMWGSDGKKYWDVKYPKSYPGTGNLYRHGLKQISVDYGPAKNSPGGLIVRITDPAVDIETVHQKLADVFRNSRLETVDLIIKKNDTDYKIFRLWKKNKSNAR